MNQTLNNLFGLDGLGFGSPGAELSLARPLPAWAWAMLVALALAIAMASYARLLAPRRARIALGLLRASTLCLLALLAAGPQLLRETSAEQRDAVIVLIDRSASMAVADRDDRLATRDDQARALLDNASPVWQALARSRDLLWLGFDAGAFRLEPAAAPPAGPAPTLPALLGEPDGPVTRLGSALDQALDLAAGRPVSAVLLVGDGRTSERPGRDVIRRLNAEGVPVFSLPVGAQGPVGDVGIARLDAPSNVFLDDIVPVRVTLERSGPDLSTDPAQPPLGDLVLVDEPTGRVITREPVDPASFNPDEPILLLARATEPGEQRWAVRFLPTGADLVSANDTAPFTLSASEEPIRVLYLDGYPRWEQRYLKTLLIRERSVTVSTVLLAAGRRYQQEGDETIAALPVTPDQWAPYDVVILGDLRAELLGEDQLQGLREHVGTRGAGLLLLAGPAAMPHGWHASALADLIPLRGSPAAPTPTWAQPVIVRPTQDARRLGLFAIGPPGDDSALPPDILDPALGWPLLRWAQRPDPASIKPAVGVLAEALPADSFTSTQNPADSAPAPLALTMRFGAGRVVYVGTDEIWRWRYGRGEPLFERFWLPIIRSLARQTASVAGAILTADPADIALGDTLTITLDLLDAALIESAPPRITALARRGPTAPPQTIELLLDAPPPDPRALPSTRVTYTAPWTPSRVGRHDLTLDEPLLAPAALTASVNVTRPDDELRQPQTDHPLLAELAAQTDGQVLDAASLADFPNRIPNRTRVLSLPPEIQTLWDRPIALALVVLFLATEWIARRLIKLA